MIPKLMRHIWIGPKPPPLEWMESWRRMNPDWVYELFGNGELRAAQFRNRRLIDAYMRRGQYSGAADLVRYELLHATGGFIPEADSVCLRPVAELFETGSIFTVYENEFARGKLVSPILASVPGHPFLQQLIDRLNQVRTERLQQPWKTTGNLFVALMIEELHPDITIFPSHYFIPEHYTGVKYRGDGPVYATQLFASTRRLYKTGGLGVRAGEEARKFFRKHLARRS